MGGKKEGALQFKKKIRRITDRDRCEPVVAVYGTMEVETFRLVNVEKVSAQYGIHESEASLLFRGTWGLTNQASAC